MTELLLLLGPDCAARAVAALPVADRRSYFLAMVLHEIGGGQFVAALESRGFVFTKLADGGLNVRRG